MKNFNWIIQDNRYRGYFDCNYGFNKYIINNELINCINECSNGSEQNVNLFKAKTKEFICKNQNLNIYIKCMEINNLAKQNNIYFAFNYHTQNINQIENKLAANIIEKSFLDFFGGIFKTKNIDCNFNTDIDIVLNNKIKFEIKSKHGYNIPNDNYSYQIKKYRKQYLLDNIDYIVFVNNIKSTDYNVIFFEIAGIEKPMDFFNQAKFIEENNLVNRGNQKIILKQSEYEYKRFQFKDTREVLKEIKENLL